MATNCMREMEAPQKNSSLPQEPEGKTFSLYSLITEPRVRSWETGPEISGVSALAPVSLVL